MRHAVGGSKELPALTEENVENGNYNYSTVYRCVANASITYFYKDSKYEYAYNDEIPAFTVEATATSARIQSPKAMMVDFSSLPATGTMSSRYLSGNSSLDAALTSATDATVTLISDNGTEPVDLITSSDTTEARFKLEDGVNYMLVFHSATTKTNITFTVEESEDIVLSLTQTCSTGNLAGGDMRGTTPGGSVTVTIGEGVPEGTYKIHLGGSMLFGRNYNFKIVVNGTDEYTTGMNMPNQTGGTGASANIKIKSGDVIVITNYNGQAMSGTISLFEV